MIPEIDRLQLLHALAVDAERYVCRRGRSFRLCNATGEYTRCVPAELVQDLVTNGLLRAMPYCPDSREPDQSLSWWITLDGSFAVASAIATGGFDGPRIMESAHDRGAREAAGGGAGVPFPARRETAAGTADAGAAVAGGCQAEGSVAVSRDPGDS